MNNREKARAILEAQSSGEISNLGDFAAAGMIQHDLRIPAGLRGLEEVILQAEERPVITVVRAFEDGDYVVLHCRYQFSDRAEVGFEVYRFEDGLAVEHWNNLTPQAAPNRSGHTQLDGTREIGTDNRDLKKNKQVAERYVREVLSHSGKEAQLPAFFHGNEHIEHNSHGADTVQAIIDLFAGDKGSGIEIHYTEIHRILGQGNFVLTMCEGTWDGTATSFYDLFRLEEGKIREHWDVIEIYGAEGEPRNENGKF